MSSFKDKNILITGGANGIGLLMGKIALQKRANKLIIWDISGPNINCALSELNEYVDRIITYHVDVSDSDQVYETSSQVLQQVTQIDILINNAGIITGKSFHDQTPNEINQTIAVNLLGAMHTTRAFLPQMIQNKTGHIVNLASAAGLMGNPKMSVYSGSKWGVIGWSESLRIELEQAQSNLNVTTVEPSYIDTGLFKGVSPPALTPLLDPKEISEKIIAAVEQNKIHLRAPFMVKLLPFLRGILPARIFDVVAGKLFQVYHSMDTFTGRPTEEQ